jgi:hypothetical protein
VLAPHGSRGPSVIEVAVSIALPVRRYRHAAWGGRVCRSTEQPLSAFSTKVEFAAAPVAVLFGATFFAGAVKILGGRLGLRQGAVGSRLAGGDMEERAEIGVGAILAQIATEPPKKSPLFAWVVDKDTPALGSKTRANDLPEHHTRDAHGESSPSHRLMEEAERRQR